jgi:predicted KAP-like P-loop ATPase
VAVLNFNPWRFPDEAQLLLSFFGELAQIIDKQLYTKGERATKILTSYVAPLIPSVGLGPATADLSKPIGEVFSKLLPDVDKLRTRLEELITESGKRVVVIIDDIDRLEKTQIQTIFRLVKLTADFKHTAYLLAFDDLMVARAIGEVFAASAESEGEGRSLQDYSGSPSPATRPHRCATQVLL